MKMPILSNGNVDFFCPVPVFLPRSGIRQGVFVLFLKTSVDSRKLIIMMITLYSF